jgi:hypothetical protein
LRDAAASLMGARWPGRISGQVEPGADYHWEDLWGGGVSCKEWNDHEEGCTDRCGPRARPGRVRIQDRGSC